MLWRRLFLSLSLQIYYVEPNVFSFSYMLADPLTQFLFPLDIDQGFCFSLFILHLRKVTLVQWSMSNQILYVATFVVTRVLQSPLLSKFERKTTYLLSLEINFWTTVWRHISIYCRHMWRMATVLDTAAQVYVCGVFVCVCVCVCVLVCVFVIRACKTTFVLVRPYQVE